MSRQHFVVALLLMVGWVGGDAFAQYSSMPPPSRWGAYGNPVPGRSLRPGFDNNLSLVVNQTQDVHRQMGNVLEQLRRMQGQQVRIGTQFHTMQDDFFERIGANFSFSLPGRGNLVGLDPLGNPTPDGSIQFRQGGFNSALPAFGGHDPAADAQTGFSILKNGAAFNFNFAAGQGNNRTLVTQAPSVVIQDGQQGFVSDTFQRPFVTGVIPVVGDMSVAPPFAVMPTYVSPLQEKIRRLREQQQQGGHVAYGGRTAVDAPVNDASAHEASASSAAPAGGSSSATRGDVSVAEIKRQKAAEKAAEAEANATEILALIERARGAEELDKVGIARIYYRMAANRAEGEQKQELLEKLKSLDDRD